MTRGAALLAPLLLLPACRATYIDGAVDENPLPRIAERAEGEYAVRWVGETRLELRDTWVWTSVALLGWITFHARLDYEDGRLTGEFYYRSITPFLLFVPWKNWASSEIGIYSAPAQGWAWVQMREVLEMGDVTAEAYDVFYGRPR